MAEIIKLIGQEITLNGTANVVASANLVKITNANTTTTTVITVTTTGGSFISNTTLLPASELYLQKNYSDKIASSLTTLVTATPVAFT